MTSSSAPSGIAIIGIACRFPGAGDHRQYWKNLRAGIESISTLSEEELAASHVGLELIGNPSYVKAASLLPDSDSFDAAFFEYSPQEARLMDPQQRLLLEVAWEAVEDAGYRVGEHPAQVGVFVGTGGVVSSYLVDRLTATQDLPGYTGSLAHLGNDKDFSSTRVSYKLNLTGPSINVQTACSTSLVATHLACQSILSGECDMALAGAGTVRVPQRVGYMSVKGGILSPDGHCRAFDADAQGTIFGSGVGFVLLKDLSAAISCGDHIYAVIRGSAVNNDGADKVSYTASSVAGQARAMVEAISVAGISADDIGYVECHGTGTAVGDPLEVDALTRAFRTGTKRCRFCAIGSVKTNIGHLEQTAGIASLIKAALGLHHGEIPPSLNFRSPNPKIDFPSTPFFVNSECRAWLPSDRPRFAAVNSLGLGGTNAFVVLQEAPRQQPRDVEDSVPRLFTVSAKSDAALQRLIARYRDWIDTADAPLSDICFTSTVGRTHFARRSFAVARSKTNLRDELDALLDASRSARVSTPEERRLAFLFSGQASQYPRMGAELYRNHDVFRDTIDRCARLLEGVLIRPLKEILLEDVGDALIHDTGATQPALFSVQAALVDLWRSWGIVPDMVLGHSVGEFAAAYCAGVYSLEQALGLIADRASLMQALPREGAMASLFLDEQSARKKVAELDLRRVSIAAINAPRSTVISGLRTEIETLEAHCRKLGVECRMLSVSHAFHSSLMEPAVDEFARRAALVSGNAPQLTWISTCSGRRQAEAPDVHYWRAQALGPVQFAPAVREVAAAGATEMIEIGPGGTLLALGEQCVSADLTWLGSLRRQSETQEILSSLGRIYCRGYEVDWASFHRTANCRRASMPTYDFEKRRYWIEDDASPPRALPSSLNPAGVRLLSSLPEVQFESIYSLSRQPYLNDHRIYGMPVMPLTLALTALTEAARQHFAAETVDVANLQYREALVLSETGERVVHLVLTPVDARMAEFRIASIALEAGDRWRTHLVGIVRVRAPAELPPALAVQDVSRRCTEFVPRERYYRAIRATGLEYGRSFQGIQVLQRGLGEALTKVQLPDSLPSDRNSGHHPALLDACLHVFPAFIDEYGDFGSPSSCLRRTYLPIGLERFHSDGEGARGVWVHAKRRAGDGDPDILTIDIGIYHEDGTFAAAMQGLSLRRLTPEELRPVRGPQSDWMYQLHWSQCPPLASKAESSVGGWLILADQAGVGTALANLLSQDGGWCRLIHVDSLKDAHGARTWESPDQLVEPFTAALRELANNRDRPLRGIVDLWPLDVAAASGDLQDLRAAQEVVVGAGAALFKAAEAIRSQGTVTPRIWLVTRNAVDVRPDDKPIESASAALWGLGRTAALEHPQLWGGLIDLEETGQATLRPDAENLHREVMGTDGEDQIALRADRRLGARLVRAAPPDPMKTTFDPAGAYLITGGLGALGLELAKWLITQRGAKHVFLVSRRGEEDPSAPLAKANLSSLGANVRLEKADITIDDQVRELIGRAHSPDRPLKGVFHCAGILDDGILAGMDWAKFERVMAPKVFGAWLLHQHTRSLTIDHFVLFSSILSLTGSAGQANYAAANAYLDALAAQRRRDGLPAIVLNFGPWADSGLATLSGEKGRAIWRARGTEYTPVATGLSAIDALVGSNVRQAAITLTRWDTFLEQFSAVPPLYRELQKEVSPRAGAAAVGDGTEWRARLSQSTGLERTIALTDFIREQVAQTLGLTETLDAAQPLRELGLDSLMSITLINKIERVIGVTIPVTKLIKGPSIEQLVQDIASDFLDGVGHVPPQPIVLPAQDSAAKWLVTSEPRPAARVRLFCFPFAGGGSAVFRSWANSLESDIEVVSVEPPGRLGRIHEEPVSDINNFVDELIKEMLPLLDKPFAFFGHCRRADNVRDGAAADTYDGIPSDPPVCIGCETSGPDIGYGSVRRAPEERSPEACRVSHQPSIVSSARRCFCRTDPALQHRGDQSAA